MDLLARRDHSEAELRERLAADFSAADIDDALEHARERRWLPEADALAGRLAESLHRQGRGIEFINRKLEEKGLPPVPADDELELEKALRLAETKRPEGELDRAAREKIGRYLLSRGFEDEIVRKVIHEKL